MKIQWRFKPKKLEDLKDGDFIICKGAGENRPRKITELRRTNTDLQWSEVQWIGGQVYIDREHEYPLDMIIPLTHGEAQEMQVRYGQTNYPYWYFDPRYDNYGNIKSS